MADSYSVEKMDMREAKFYCRNYDAKITEKYLEIKDGDISLRFSLDRPQDTQKSSHRIQRSPMPC